MGTFLWRTVIKIFWKSEKLTVLLHLRLLSKTFLEVLHWTSCNPDITLFLVHFENTIHAVFWGRSTLCVKNPWRQNTPLTKLFIRDLHFHLKYSSFSVFGEMMTSRFRTTQEKRGLIIINYYISYEKIVLSNFREFSSLNIFLVLSV